MPPGLMCIPWTNMALDAANDVVMVKVCSRLSFYAAVLEALHRGSPWLTAQLPVPVLTSAKAHLTAIKRASPAARSRTRTRCCQTR